MPRIARNKVEFDVNGTTWLAEFEHMHVQKNARTIPNTAGFRLQHVTRCFLSRKDHANIEAEGRSQCSMRDVYNWRVGIKMALLRALHALNKDITFPDKADPKPIKVGEKSQPFIYNFFFEMRRPAPQKKTVAATVLTAPMKVPIGFCYERNRAGVQILRPIPRAPQDSMDHKGVDEVS